MLCGALRKWDDCEPMGEIEQLIKNAPVAPLVGFGFVAHGFSQGRGCPALSFLWQPPAPTWVRLTRSHAVSLAFCAEVSNRN